MIARLFAVGLLALAGPAFAQTGQTVGYITQDDVVVRGSPRADGPDTGTLPRGTTVIVHHAEGDAWLAIQAPRGAVSWVNHLFIKSLTPGSDKYPQVWAVSSDVDVRIAVGKPGTDQPLNVRLAAVPDGTLLTVIGQKVKATDDNSWWYPIMPPVDDFRFVPKAAVRMEGPAQTGFVVKSPDPKPTLPSESSPAPGRSVVGSSHSLWVQAQQAEAAGDTERAEKLYFQLAREMNGPGGDPDLANQCYTRIHALRDKRPPAAATSTTKPSSRPEEPESKVNRWTGPGYLRPATFRVNGKPAFALEDNRQRVLYYAIAGPGVDLSRYERRTVDLNGDVIQMSELRGVGLVTVTKVDAVK